MDEGKLNWCGAPSELQPFGPRFTARVQLLDNIFRRVRPRFALDIGCGRGAVTRILAQRAGTIIATEVSEEAVQAATQSLADVANVEVHLLDLFAGHDDAVPRSNQRFGLILLSEVLEHLDDDVGALLRIRQLIEESGVLVITVPRDPAMWSIEDELWGHRRRYLKRELLAKLSSAGFRTKTVWTWGFPVTRFLVSLQVRRLKKGSRRATGRAGASYRLPRPLLHLARWAFLVTAKFEQIFKHTDRGVGYIVVAEPVPESR